MEKCKTFPPRKLHIISILWRTPRLHITELELPQKELEFFTKKNLPSMLCLFIVFFSTTSFSQPTRLQIPHLTSHVPFAATPTKRRTRSSRRRIRRETPRRTQAPQQAPATTNAWRFDSKNRRRKIEERAEETKNV